MIPHSRSGGRGRRWRAALMGVFVVGAIGLAFPAFAHDVDVTSIARVFLDEVRPSEYRLSVVDMQVPVLPTSGVLPARCEVEVVDPSQGSPVNGLHFRCPDGLMFDDTIVLPWTLAGVVVLAKWSDGTEASAYFRGAGGVVPIELGALRAGAPSVSRLAATYTVLGAEHILFGIDHLMFVAGLLLLIHGGWALVRTVTAFTVAHSLTLAAAVLGWVPVAVGPVEAAIALSIVMLAREIVLGSRDDSERYVSSLTARAPWIVAFAFGLLHGFGFAGALGGIGLRAADIPAALLFFNVGVELGQLGFLVVALVGYHAVVRLAKSVPGTEKGRSLARPALGYALGAVATLWFVQRLPAVLGLG